MRRAAGARIPIMAGNGAGVWVVLLIGWAEAALVAFAVLPPAGKVVALFLNGIPVATCELKSNFTQSVGDAVDQYRFDRHPRPKGQSAAEPLLSTLAHGGSVSKA